MKIAVCCDETNSVNNRLSKITKELDRCPYKLGLLIVTIQNDPQAVSMQSVLQKKAAEANEPRLTIALVKKPFTVENRNKWLAAVTKQEMASESGQTGSAQQYKFEASAIINSWVKGAVDGSRIIAYNGSSVFDNIYGMRHLSKIIHANVLNAIFTFAPENIVVTNTAYKTCNDGASIAGIRRKSSNSQLNNVLNSFLQKKLRILEKTIISELNAAGIDFIRNGTEPHIPGSLSLSFYGADGEMLLHRLDLMGIMVSTGSACDSKTSHVSHVLNAINVDPMYAKGIIRISLGRDNNLEEAARIADALIKIISKKQ